LGTQSSHTLPTLQIYTPQIMLSLKKWRSLKEARHPLMQMPCMSLSTSDVTLHQKTYFRRPLRSFHKDGMDAQNCRETTLTIPETAIFLLCIVIF
jgi:hypothetical protein